MKKFTNQSNGSHRGHSLMGRVMIRRFALFPMMLLMLLLLPARMAAHTEASSSKYIATYDSDTETLTFKKYEGESLPSNSAWVKDGTLVFELNKDYLGRQDIKHIVLDESFKTFTPTSLKFFFALLFSLETIQGLEYLNTTNVTDMSGMFNHCVRLTSLDVTHFNTEKVTNMSQMFHDCPRLASLDVTSFNTANVTDMENMFSAGPNLKTIYASDKFVTNAVTKSSGMFAGCESLSGDIDWTPGNATDKTYAKLDGGYFREKGVADRPWVKYADGTLTFRCGYKKTLGENEYELNSGENRPEWFTHYFETSKVVFEASFANARPTSCYAWFRNFKNLTQIEGIENLNTENVTSMSSMFDSCSGLISLDVTNFNTANVTHMSYMFYCCYKLKEIYVSDKFVTDDVISSAYMFMGCNSLSGDIDWASDKATDKTYAKTDGGYFRDKAYDNRPWVKFADGTLTFRCGYKKTLGENEYALNSGENLPKWYVNNTNTNTNLVVFDASFANARPTSCYAWFRHSKNLTQIAGIENLNTANVTNMREMFNGCSNLVKLDVTNFNTAKVTTMLGMFYDCSNLTELDVTHFNTAKVTTMFGMFGGCSNLAELDVTHFNTANVTNMDDMFYACKSLTTIYVSDKFVINNESYDLFSGCIKLKGAIKYTEGKVNYRSANYTTGYFTKLVGKNGDEKIGAAGETLATENLLLDDDKDFVAYEPFAAKAASYSRPVKEGSTWGTLCLPFAIDQSKETECKFYRLTGIDNDCITLESYEEGAEIPAGTPVLFKMNEGEQTLSISAQDAGIVTEPKTGTNTDVNLVGSFTKIGGKDNKGLDDNDYIISKNKFWRVADLTGGKGVGSKPMHAYIHPVTASQARVAMLSIGKGDGTTAIDNLNAISNDANAEYYDANGLRTNGLQKGLNIVKRGSKTYKIMVK